MNIQRKHWVTVQITTGILFLVPALFATDVAPPASEDGNMVFDAGRQEIMLYGVLVSANVGLTQTWVWNGGWSMKAPITSPPGVKSGGMAYDQARQQTVFFGGANSPTNNTWTFNTNTWLWNGTNWAMATSISRPSGRFANQMAYDSLRQQVVLFGGGLATQTGTVLNTNDTWVWDGLGWTLKNPASRPSVRGGAGLVFDAARGQTVLFGGLNNGAGDGDFNDTWVWDGTNWTKKIPLTSPPTNSVYRGMTYDSTRQEVVLFGGFTRSGYTNGTWTWNGSNWFYKTPSAKPASRAGHQMAFDPTREKVVMFGGEDSSSKPLADTWLWDGTNWQSSDMTLSLAASPSLAFVGSNLTYTVNVTNRGPSVADEVQVVEEVPASVGFVSAVASQGTCSYSNGVMTCDLGSVPMGTNLTVSMIVAPSAIGTITNVATVLCSAELSPSNNVASIVSTVVSPPIVHTPLTNQTASANGQLILNVGVSGSSPLTYQWLFNGTNLPGQSSSSLSLSNLDWSQAGYYTVVISNPYGSVTDTALLSVDDLHMYAGIRIAGAPGAGYRIDARNSLQTNDAWFTLTNFALPYSPYLFIDENSPNHPQRFYQVISP